MKENEESKKLEELRDLLIQTSVNFEKLAAATAIMFSNKIDDKARSLALSTAAEALISQKKITKSLEG